MEGSTTEAVKAALKRGRQVFRVAYSATAGARGLLGTLVALAATIGDVCRRLLKVKAGASSATTVKTQLISAGSVIVATSIATIAVVGVAHDWRDATGQPRVIDAPPTAMLSSTSALESPHQSAAVLEHGTPTGIDRTATTPSGTAPADLRHTVAAPVPGDQRVVLLEVYVTTDCEQSDTRRATCATVSAAIAGTATPEVPLVPAGADN
jgi:hypothetical protein